MALRLVSYNVKLGGRGRAGAIADVLQASGADVAVLQEATQPAVVAAVSRDTGLMHVHSRPGHSLAVLSRIPVRLVGWHRGPGVRHPFLEVRLPDTGLRVLGVHLWPRLSRWGERRRMREIARLFDVIGDGPEDPLVVVGDYNAVAPGEAVDTARMPYWLRSLIRLGGGAIPRDVIAAVMARGLTDGYRMKHDRDTGHTFPTPTPHVRLDYAFLSATPARHLSDCRVLYDGAATTAASDHFPLLVETEP